METANSAVARPPKKSRVDLFSADKAIDFFVSINLGDDLRAGGTSLRANQVNSIKKLIPKIYWSFIYIQSIAIHLTLFSLDLFLSIKWNFLLPTTSISTDDRSRTGQTDKNRLQPDVLCRNGRELPAFGHLAETQPNAIHLFPHFYIVHSRSIRIFTGKT